MVVKRQANDVRQGMERFLEVLSEAPRRQVLSFLESRYGSVPSGVQPMPPISGCQKVILETLITELDGLAKPEANGLIAHAKGSFPGPFLGRRDGGTETNRPVIWAG